MGRIIIKGGVWKNTEDEILKAAVMKYGKNQWSRIASLLHRKSSKQCKARWYEWLDPSIKKTEWSREEEEKLLHLAKLMPTQWRTIAPIIGRTAAQCLEHYEKLLDQAQAADGEFDPKDDPRRLRPGEIDPNPHTKPARPDQIDMDEDEKEMLSEARARLANTQGKKAKRKAREKSLEEARRLASLQKRRELRAAGIDTFARKKQKRGVDYNAEIPFEKKPALGFFDVTKDGTPTGRDFTRISREDAHGGPRRDKEEAKKRKDDLKRHEEQQKSDMPRAVMQMNKMTDDGPQRKRSKLVMPAPQTSDVELEELVKMGQSAEAAMAAGSENGANLLQDYSATPSAALLARTPRAPASEDPLLREAQNIIALNQTESVLEGGANTPLHNDGGSFEGVTPSRQQLATPNTVLSTPYRQASVSGTPGGRTPADAALAATPLRDKLSINTEMDSSLLTPRSHGEQLRQAQQRNELREGLAALPKPSAEFDIVVPDVPEEEEAAVKDGFVEDAADVDVKSFVAMQEAEEAKRRQMSQAYQRGLPIPREVNRDILRTSTAQNEEQMADEEMKKEILDLVRFDKGLPLEKKRDMFSEPSIGAAKALLEEEMLALHDAAKPEDADRYPDVWEQTQDEVTYLSSAKRYGRTSSAKERDKVSALEFEMTNVKKQMMKDHKAAEKVQKKQVKLTMGFQTRSKKQLEAVYGSKTGGGAIALCDKIAQAKVDLHTFERLRDAEVQALPFRKQKLEREVAQQIEREADLQARYGALVDKRDAAFSRLKAIHAAANTLSAAPVAAK